MKNDDIKNILSNLYLDLYQIKIEEESQKDFIIILNRIKQYIENIDNQAMKNIIKRLIYNNMKKYKDIDLDKSEKLYQIYQNVKFNIITEFDAINLIKDIIS